VGMENAYAVKTKPSVFFFFAVICKLLYLI